MALVLLSAHTVRFSVSRMRDNKNYLMHSKFEYIGGERVTAKPSHFPIPVFQHTQKYEQFCIRENLFKAFLGNISWFNILLNFSIERVVSRGTRYCCAWRKHSCETNKWTMFLETEAAFPYCNWSINIARIICFGSTSVDIGPAYVNNWQRLDRLPFWV